MAYVLGLICADGAVEDVRKSSRTCYVCLVSKDKSLLYQVRSVLSSNHKIYKRPSRVISFLNRNKHYISSDIYYLRIGNKAMFQDLVNLGIKPRKSLRLCLPRLPEKYFGFFLRGYFDGDGCLYAGIPKGRHKPRVRICFTSGTLKFLKKLSIKLNFLLGTPVQKVYSDKTAYKLLYSRKEGLKILDFIYKGLDKAPYLERKYAIYKKIA